MKFRGPSLNVLEKFHPKSSEAAISTVFFRDNFRPEMIYDVISGVAADFVGMGVDVKFGGFISNVSQDIRGAHVVSNERTNMPDVYRVRQN